MKTVGFRPMVIWAITCMAFLGFSSGALATDLTPFTTSSGPGLTVVQEGVGLGGLTSATMGGVSIPLTITIDGEVEGAFLYWAGRDSRPCTDLDADCVVVVPGDEPFRDQELVFDGNAITGTLIGQENQLPSREINNIGYREDVTSIVEAMGEGTHTFLIQDGDTSNNLSSLNGATLLVVYTDSTDPTSYEVQVFDGLDFAYIGDSALHAQVTVPIVFGYLPDSSSRTADLLISVGDAKDSRPDRIDVSDTTGTTSFIDELNSMSGAMWDAWTKPITIPADVSSTTVQLFSEGNPNNTKTPDSLLWEMAALRIPIEADVPDIDIRKQEEGPDSRTFPSGSDVDFEIVVTNTGTVDLINVVVTDVLVGNCVRNPGDNPNTGNLAAGASFTYTCTDLDVQAGYTNVAKVTGEHNGDTVMDEDPSTVVIAAIDIRKQTEGPDSRSFPSGSDVDFEIVVTNTGTVDLVNVNVTDGLAADCDSNSGEFPNPAVLVPWASFTYTCTASNVIASFDNVACVVGEDVNGVMVDDCDPSEVVIETVSGTCDDGKPMELVFEYTGQSCAASTNQQEGKFTCSGDPAGAAPVQLVVEDANANPSTESILIGGLVTVTPTGSKLASQTEFEIQQSGQVLQDLSIHLSCSKDLNVGDVFGSLTLRVFVPTVGGGGMGGMGGMGGSESSESGGMGGMGGMN